MDSHFEQSKQILIYTLAGGFPSKAYKLTTWKYNNKDIEAPIPSQALFRFYKEQKDKEVKLKVLIPLSIFDYQDIAKKDFDYLKNLFKKDFENFHTQKLEHLLSRLKSKKISVKETKRIYEEIKALSSFVIQDIDWKDLDELYEDYVLRKEDLSGFHEQLEEFLKEQKIKERLVEKDKEWQKLFNNSVEYEIIPSLGEYKKGEKKLKFRANFQDRSLFFYSMFAFDFINHIGSNKKFLAILDVSTGLNSLVVELLDSFYNAVVFWKFYHIGGEDRGKFRLISAEPVMDIPKKGEYKHFSTESVKRIAFFAKPMKYQDYKGLKKLKNLFKRFTERDLQDFFNQSIFLFNITEKGIILGITLWDKLEKPQRQMEVLRNFIKGIKSEVFSERVIEDRDNFLLANLLKHKINFSKFRNLTFLLMLGINLTNSYIEIFKDFYDGNLRYIGEGLPIKRARDLYGKLFEKYNLILNKVFLNKEWNENRISQIKSIPSLKENEKIPLAVERIYKNWLKSASSAPFSLNRAKRKRNNHQTLKEFSSPDKVRNFLAHMGTEDGITLFYVKNDELYLEYGKEFKEELKRFILSDFILKYIPSKI